MFPPRPRGGVLFFRELRPDVQLLQTLSSASLHSSPSFPHHHLHLKISSESHNLIHHASSPCSSYPSTKCSFSTYSRTRSTKSCSSATTSCFHSCSTTCHCSAASSSCDPARAWSVWPDGFHCCVSLQSTPSS